MTAKHIQEAWDKLCQERDELAAQVDSMRDALQLAVETDQLQGGLWEERAVAVLALPNTAATILRQRDARTLREAAEICASVFEGQVGMVNVVSMRCAAALNAKANELERKNG